MRRKSLLSGSIIVIATTTLLISEWRAQSQPSSVQYESRRLISIQKEVYYTNPVISKPEQTSEDDDYKSITVTPTPIIVGERELVGIGSTLVSDLKIEKKVEKPVIKNRWNIELTDDEIDLLARIVWIESRGESDEGECGVIEVILNRMIHWDFKGSLYDVLSKDGEFCSWSLRDKAEPTEKEYKNIKKVLNGKTDILGSNKVYFSTSPRNDINPKQIGNHWFCDYEYTNKEDKR
jgi:hypothetical protein